MRLSERKLTAVPRLIWLILAGALATQITLRALQPKPEASATALSDPPSVATLRLLSLNETTAVAQLTTLYLQAFDNQPSVSIPFKDLNYDQVTHWLATVLTLDPSGQYPLLLASQVYTQVPDDARVRLMLAFVQRQFGYDPDRRWRWLANAVIIAKHHLHDDALALRYARDITRLAPAAPDWARQMHIFILEDIGEVESARILLGGLLESGQITDSHELHFLMQRLDAMKNVEKPSGATKN